MGYNEGMESYENAVVEPGKIRLLDGERIVNVQIFDSRHPRRPPSAIKELRRLTSTTGSSKVGDNGPSIAALSYESDIAQPDHQGLYSVVFGRDSLRVAIDLTTQYPSLARTTILKLAEVQGTSYVTAKEEEPGRIAHEIRDPHDPIAEGLTLKRGWGWPYYGSVDATPEFIRTLSRYCKLGGDSMSILAQKYRNKDGEELVVADALESAIRWITTRMDQNREGLLEYQSVLPDGLENQVWKDSWDAYHHSDGTIANHEQGIASIEVQTVTHDALLDAAHLYEHVLDRSDDAAELRERADALQKTIINLFWTEDKGGYFVLGTDRDDNGKPRQLRIRTSNMGHVLNSNVIDGNNEEHAHKRDMTLKQLKSAEMLAASGIRTLASDEVRYRDGAYHNGSVWIWDTHHIALGARRHTHHNPEFGAFANDIENRILTVVNTIGGFPEYVRGGDTIATNAAFIDIEDTKTGRIYRGEQPPQEIQAWTVAAILATKIRRGSSDL
jgi:glycogen debranching enzyme